MNVAELAAEKGLVLFLVPKADTRQSPLPLRIRGFSTSPGFSNIWYFSWLHKASVWLPGLVS